MTNVLWSPSSERAEQTEVAALCRELGLPVDFSRLHEWSTENLEDFWQLVWERYDVIGDRSETTAFVPADDDRAPGSFKSARFFPDARLNVAENLLTVTEVDPTDHVAIVFANESGHGGEVTLADLRSRVSILQQAMIRAGVRIGDVVAAWLPNTPDTMAIFLAANSIGAVFTSSSPDFGADGVVDRFGQTEPKLLFATDAYLYAGKVHDTTARLADIVSRLPSVSQTIFVPYLNHDAAAPPDTLSMAEFVSGIDATEPHFERVDFDHPIFVLFSSGTTGKPKAIVHRSGGVLLKLLSEQRIHCDISPGDRVFYFTTAGWMMWNWLVMVMVSEATVVLYDGSPFHPSGNVLFDVADRYRTTLFGVSAKFIDAVNKAGLHPADTHDLSSIRTVCSTGSTLVHESFEFVYEHIAADVHLASMSGGTDLCGCLVAGDPTAAVRAGEIQAPAIGLDIAVVDDHGRRMGPGVKGELVCTTPFPSVPLGFVDDPDDARFDGAYFDRFPGMWHQGDYAQWTESGGMIISGRSDATLNPGGVRIGTAEIYRQVEQLDEVAEALVIGQSWDGDTRVVLFVRMADEVELDDSIRDRIRRTIREGASPRHVPARIVQVSDIPRTRSGKISELAVRDVVEGREVANTEALANPEALEHFRDRPELAE